MVDVAAGFGIDQRHAGLAIEMAGEIGELVGEDFEDRGVDLNSADVLGAEKQSGKNVATAADANDGDVGRRLHQIGGIDDVVLQVGQLAEIAIVPGDDRAASASMSRWFWSIFVSGVRARPQPNGVVSPSAVTRTRE